MKHPASDGPRIPAAPRSIQKGSSLGDLLDRDAVDCLAHNISLVQAGFDRASFRRAALKGLAPLAILQRGQHLARVLREHLPERYSEAILILLRSLTPPLSLTDDFGLAGFFYLPHVSFVATYGLDAAGNGGRDPFEISMEAQYELTRRFSAEFSMRQFLICWPERTLARLMQWTGDPDPHVRRLCACAGWRNEEEVAEKLVFSLSAIPVVGALRSGIGILLSTSIPARLAAARKAVLDFADDLGILSGLHSGSRRQPAP